ncbi:MULTISPECIES: cbb3-type cytochrome oxidase subunit 3 [Pseudomonas]|uniref:CcoQ/FixQ family Cbb3-type cytochrome c oxidase assembly chaperone n=1 Tax=Pseudomonas gessardii TaxID=78544 RepID=A0A7Y1MK46_9PSED|nr:MULTISPECIES: cbb3-type cytochrome c oxidase subunit 3 [Pseudomonas]MBH3424061.1 CcoQ/FixQ family Cbb3-type cytochrome c oxidase assembly chaperone [Pseudomonas gessardii]MCF4978973.1 CcoQ/FixQ family Cbb3-type cytochrome c oxidase assembly chaperone [Pseudomonas gessardii]MCF4989452.1 CcoQ/FixQ family Cbb3-type cytochrome c oxidase assembly chaperone [Pseudomonas gessardii]MCF5084011.1 CcoQ/FixQ family Cbb3-type cytochrome c oxidase assembly chaperone [Pseudomonas gessardii]MCF5093341.1 Cc
MGFELDTGMIRGLGTLVVAIAFIGLSLWVFNAKRNPEFAEACLLPFADEPKPDAIDTPSDAQEEPVTRSIRP